jgi:hypothetical protein
MREKEIKELKEKIMELEQKVCEAEARVAMVESRASAASAHDQKEAPNTPSTANQSTTESGSAPNIHPEEEEATNQGPTTKGEVGNVPSTDTYDSAESTEEKEANNRESPRAECPPAATTRKESTPVHSTSRKRSVESPGDDSDLMDTPELQLPKMKGNKKLQKNAKENPVRPVPMRSDEHCVDEWTNEEGKQKEYGIERNILRRYGTQKIHVENLKRVMSTYPALKEVMDHKMNEINDLFVNSAQERAERVAEEIRGVPLSKETLLEKKELGLWFHDTIACPQTNVPECCQYSVLAQHAFSLSKEQQQRSAKLYQQKMEEDSKPMKFMQCGAHENGKDRHCLPMSK